SLFAIGAFVSMFTTSDFFFIGFFYFLAVATGLRCFLSLLLAVLDVHAISVKRKFSHPVCCY
ncbi:hypothetical protein SOVF_021400, partial [Spinacia oleracea]